MTKVGTENERIWDEWKCSTDISTVSNEEPRAKSAERIIHYGKISLKAVVFVKSWI